MRPTDGKAGQDCALADSLWPWFEGVPVLGQQPQRKHLST